MKKDSLKKIAVAVLLLVVAGAGIAYYKWNQPHTDVKGAKGLPISSAKLYTTFATDSTAAKKSFTGKILEVTGEIGSVSKNQQNQTVVVMKVDSTDASVNCTLEDAETAGLAPGKEAKLKGICDGYLEGDLGLSGNVVMVRCYIVK